MSRTPEVSNLSFTNLSYLRDECIDRMRKHPDEEWSDRDGNVIAWVMGRESVKILKQLREDKVPIEGREFDEEPLLLIASREVDELKLPKWATLVGWLAPEGLSAEVPEAVAKVAKYALGIERDEIEREIPRRVLDF